MFSPPSKRFNFSARKTVANRKDDDSTPVASNRRPLLDSPAVPKRPVTGTPAPWASRLSVPASIPRAKRIDKGDDVGAAEPVYIGEFPQVLRHTQMMSSQNHIPADASVSGGMDKETSLAWIICGNRLFIWNFLASAASRKCIDIDLKSVMSAIGDVSSSLFRPNNWLVGFVIWDSSKKAGSNAVEQFDSFGIILCYKKNGAVIFWPEISNANMTFPFISHAFYDKLDNKAPKFCYINSLITSPVSAANKSCIALACSSNNELWRFFCSLSGIHYEQIDHVTSNKLSQVNDNDPSVPNKGYPRSLTWQFCSHSSDEITKQFLLLTNHEIQCYAVKLSSHLDVTHLWSHEIIGNDDDLGVQKNLAGQKRIWPLDLAVDSDGKVITVLIAIFYKDQVSSSSYTEYSLLTMQYKSGVVLAKPIGKQILEKKAPSQVIIPKARVEDEGFFFSMRLKVGGMPAGSAIILSGDGTATVSHCWRNLTKLYQFDLPNDGGKVLDASVFRSLDESEDGPWVVLTEKAGVWAIPERAVLLGGVEPDEHSLTCKWSSNNGSLQEERDRFSVSGIIGAKRASLEASDADDREQEGLTGVVSRSPQDEESESLLNQIFHDFFLSGKVDGAFDKLKHSRAFEREGEINVFARTSKSIVDTLAKHWTTTRGSEIAFSVMSTQLVEKQQKHQKFLQFLALSKCHEELCSRQRQSMQIIMEHGEKLVGMIQLRELLNLISHALESGTGSYYDLDARTAGALWDLIQLVGERARRKTVHLMNRDNAEVFYSKVSDLEELFHCLEGKLEYIISQNMPILVQSQRACELANACVTIFRASVEYKAEHHLWYPPPEGLTPWYSKAVVWSGMWNLASFMFHLLNETNELEDSVRFEFYSNLEVLTEILLESYSNAIMAKVERKQDHRSLLEEYSKCRDTLLDSLYKQVTYFVRAKLQDSAGENKELNRDTVLALSSKLLSISKRHEGYPTMWSICSDLNDSELLRSLMHENIGPKGGFSCFVFKQLYESKQFLKLMRLGEEFHDELATFLKQHANLLWLHELFLRQFSLASDTLHALSLPKDNKSISDTDEIEPRGPCRKLTLAKRKHFLNLAKLSAMAGRDVGYEVKVKRIEADLNILRVQEEMVSLLPDGSEEKHLMEQKLLNPVDLIEMCLSIKIRELSLRAFDLFSWTTKSFVRGNTSLLEECWRNAASQDNWARLYRLSVNDGWSEKKTSEALEQTVLFQAASKCYGPHSQTFEVKFDEVLPLTEGMGMSVEGVIKQHEDYPDAGNLMLTAVVLGSVWDESGQPPHFME